MGIGNDSGRVTPDHRIVQEDQADVRTEQVKRRAKHRLTGSRVLCLSEGQMLLVRHEDSQTGASYWVLPGGGRVHGERFGDTAVREVREETRASSTMVDGRGILGG
ncbi:MAG: NUDIX domain-containing protein [Burkholderiales bacterium]